ncbi:MAG: hypothetical protein K6A64_10385 [Bacteroidales bacterium]|nr:hypothetical protein [Bacteroidales bacterium]
MKRLFLLFLLLLFPACDKNQGDGRRSDWDPHGDHSYERDPYEFFNDSLLITGVEYPSGYDWVRDTAHSSVKASILLFRGPREHLRIPCGGGEPWPTDPDCHRIWDGHLYTFATIDGCTVIGRDGEEVLRYSAAESIRGFAVDEGQILTLGQNVSGHGLSFRKDGRVMFLSDEGTVVGSLDRGVPRSGALYCDNGHWYFSFREGGRVHLVEDNLERALPAEVILDARVFGKKLYLAYCVQSMNRNAIYISYGGYKTFLEPRFREDIRSAGFVCDGNQVRLIADVAGARYVWDVNSTRLIDIYRESYCELYPRRGGDAAVITGKGRVVRIDPYGEPPEGDFCFVSGACALSTGNSFMVGLSGLDGQGGLILRDSVRTVFYFNGPITSLCLE